MLPNGPRSPAESRGSRQGGLVSLREDCAMQRSLAALLIVGSVAWLSPEADAQTPGEVFRKVAPSVVVIRAKGHEVATSGQTRFSETGSGVLISPDGKV